jgi:hypothetical protein
MKLNFWQWLGIILVIVGGAFWIYEKNTATDPVKSPPPTTQPQ